MADIRENNPLPNPFHPLATIALGLAGLGWMFGGQHTQFDQLGLGIGTSVSFPAVLLR